MLAFLPAPLIAVFVVIFYALLTFLLPIPILFIGIFYYLIPNKRWRVITDRGMQAIGKGWGDISNGILWLFTNIEWKIKGVEQLEPEKSYLIIANHQSWADIIIIQKVFNRKIPLSRYFIKQQLAHVPIIGWCCKLLHFPTMQRYSKEFLAKRPALKGKDIETTRRSCEKFREIPVTLINFAEGTRFTAAKQQKFQSPYQFLLPPRAGGISFVLSTLGEYLGAILKVTIIYDKHSPSLWDFFTGQVKRVTVDVKKIPITKELLGDYQNDAVFRQQFQQWINQVWQDKDELLKDYLETKNELF